MAKSYQMGHWTKGTLSTLEFIENQNIQNIKPRAKDMPTGTLRNWAYVLKKGDYLKNGDGFVLTEKGKDLLRVLSRNPPRERRGKIKKRIQQIVTKQKTDDEKSDAYRLVLEGADMILDTKIPRDWAMEILSTIASRKK
ncbi:MAG: hypothetical protein V1740_05520 [Candidatus Woesearchaeota archaeon]